MPDAALYQTRSIIEEMLQERPDVLTTMVEQGVRVAIMAEGAGLTELPEFSHFDGSYWDDRVRGGGVGPTFAVPVVVVAEENLLCYENDVFPYEDIVVHEFAHGVLNMGIELQTGGREFRDRLEAAYEDALRAGLWADTYAGTNPDEYWAEGVQSWFGLNDPPGPIHNHINTRSELEEYDPVLAGLIQEVFGDGVVSASCHETVDTPLHSLVQGVVTGPAGKPLADIGLWVWQGERITSGFGRTGADGKFAVRVPNGSFTLDVYAPGEGCTFVGWYDGSGGITTDRRRAFEVIVDDASVAGIEIRLPAQPGDLPRIEHCAP